MSIKLEKRGEISWRVDLDRPRPATVVEVEHVQSFRAGVLAERARTAKWLEDNGLLTGIELARDLRGY